MARFYVDLALAENSIVKLPLNTISHIYALRIKHFQQVILFNGNGKDYCANLLKLTKKEVIAEVTSSIVVNNESPVNISLYVSIIAQDKFDLIIQKSVELGVFNIVPIYTKHTQRFNSNKVEQKLNHWQKISIAASEQSKRAKVVEISKPQEFINILAISTPSKYILTPANKELATNQQQEWTDVSLRNNKPLSSIALVIGPEGGLTSNELIEAQKNNFYPLTLGPRVLRSETAAIVALSLLQAKFGDFNLIF